MALLGMNSDGFSSRDCSSTPPVIFGMRSGVSAVSSGGENRSSGWLSSLLSIDGEEGNAAEISKLGSTGFSVH